MFDKIQELLKLDNEFILISNQNVIDEETSLLESFSDRRDSLIKSIELEFSSNNYTVEEKEKAYKEIENSTLEVNKKFRELQSQIKKYLVKNFQAKNAYQSEPIVEGSFFIDKLI